MAVEEDAAAADLCCEVRSGAMWITLNRPEAANALRPAQRNQLIEWLEEASAEADVRVVVLTATGRHFCSGADLGPGGDVPPTPPAVGDISRVLRRGAQRLIAAVLDCEKPVIAEVHGAAAGIGAHLALACDFVVAAADARFIEVFVRRALVPDGGGAYLLPRLIGPLKAKELMMLGDDLPAAAAAQLGLVTEVVEQGDLRAHTEALATRLAAAPTRTLSAIKWLVNSSLDSSRAQSFADEALAQERNMTTEDAQEGMASFGERRPASYRGR
jgi:2-(1,2-epoxy-1,2-dihydrophenyl)acetyl-CoA isomerase